MLRMAQFYMETSNPHPGFDVVRVCRGKRLKLPQGGVIRARICQSFGFRPGIRRLLGHEQGQTKNRGGYEDHCGESSLVQPPAHRRDRGIRSNAEGTTFFGRATSHFSEVRSTFYRVLAEFAAIELPEAAYAYVDRGRHYGGIVGGRERRSGIFAGGARASGGGTRPARAGDPRRPWQPDWRHRS